MKFDVIIGNPPYQLNVNQKTISGEVTDSAIPLYNIFINKAKELNPKYISMIVPSRWMKGGKGLKAFREIMMNDERIKHITDYESSSDVFANINIDGGVCYFLWDKNHKGKLDYIYNSNNKKETIKSKRYLKNKFIDVIVRDSRQLSIIEKTRASKEKEFKQLVMQNPFGLLTDLFNNSDKYSNINISSKIKDGYNLTYGVVGNKGGAKRITKYVRRKDVQRSQLSIDKYKLFLSRAFSSDSTVPPSIIKGVPGTLSTQTFFKIGDFETEEEMNNCLSYIKTKFFRALFHFKRSAFHLSMSDFELIPLQDFSKPWTDEELYKKYKLTQEEIDYIEENIEEMK